MRSSWLSLLVVATHSQACLRERGLHHGHSHAVEENHRQLQRRQDIVQFPPVLDANEQVLVNSFNATDIDSWSYFYTHGAHLAGTNKTMAQWTADRWSESGFDASLAEYSKVLAYD